MKISWARIRETWREKRKNKKNHHAQIYPLSANPNLNTDEQSALEIYHCRLDAAFREPRIRNIAVTGSFGIGKSSILHSYQRHFPQKGWKNRRAGDFLYISLGEFFANPKAHERDSEQLFSPEERNELNQLERRILLQIYARFHMHDIPAGNFKLIPEKPKCRKLKAGMFAAFVFSIFLLIFHEQLGALLKRVCPQLAGFTSPLHLAVFLFVLLFLAYCGYTLFAYCSARMEAANLTVKSDWLEFNLGAKNEITYLDHYSMELIYCLESISPKIAFTVVFEDLDRLEPKFYEEILSRLREINQLVNCRMKGKQYIRFIYVLNDAAVSDLQQTKFFDYILSIYPVLTPQSSEQIFLQMLKVVDSDLCARLSCSPEIFDFVEENGMDVLKESAKAIRDHRVRYHIFNEYSLMVELADHQSEYPLNQEDLVYILAFAIYKCLWPHDYGMIWENKSKIFPVLTLTEEELEQWNDSELLRFLTKADLPLLNWRCLYLVGYPQKAIWDFRRSMLRKNSVLAIQVFDQIAAFESENIECLFEELRLSEDLHEEEVFRAAVRCALRTNYHRENSAWFFSGRSLLFCLEVLVPMQDEEIIRFFALSDEDRTNDAVSVFSACTDYNLLENLKVYSRREAEILCAGIPTCTESLDIKMKCANGTEEYVNFHQMRADWLKQRKVEETGDV